MPKVLTVLGATGNQGGSVIDLVLSNPTLSSKYKLRAVTRSPASKAGKALAARGCEVVQGDVDDVASLKTAFAGSYAVFGVTISDFFSGYSQQQEVQQGKNIADACKAAGVKHLVWSSLPHGTKLSNGKITKAYQFDAKADVEDYIESIKGDMITTHFYPGWFMPIVKESIRPGPDGIPTLTYFFSPDLRVAFVDIEADTGKYVLGALEAGAAANGAQMQAVSEWATLNDIAATTSEVAGRQVKTAQVPVDVWRGFLPEQMKDPLVDTIKMVEDHDHFGKGAESWQEEGDRFFLKGAKKSSWREFAERNKPWKW